jgi:hypothetical protein
MAKCEICGRYSLSEEELRVHIKYFHNEALHKPQCSQPQSISQGVCPDCGSTLFYTEGCVKCQSCGYSKCG